MTMEYRVYELEGARLDLAVAMAEGKHNVPHEWGNAGINDLGRCSIAKTSWDCARYFEPSKRWSDGGPIIERNDWLLPYRTPGHRLHLGAYSSQTPGGFEHSGPTPLVAAMRAFCAAKFGETVELP
jgi:hypothetical protein